MHDYYAKDQTTSTARGSQEETADSPREQDTIMRLLGPRHPVLEHVFVEDNPASEVEDARHDEAVKLRVRLNGQDLSWAVQPLDAATRAAAEADEILGDLENCIAVHLVKFLVEQMLDRLLHKGSSEGSLTIEGTPSSFWPSSFRLMLSTEISHPPGLTPTFAPKARAIIWCPKQIPTTGFSVDSKTPCRYSTSFRIHGSFSKAVCPGHV